MATGRVYKRGRIWWIQYSVNGRPYWESAKTTRKEDAQALLRERLQSIWEGRFFPSARKRAQKTIGELRDLWLDEKGGKRSLRSDQQRFGAFVDHVGQHRQLTTIATSDVLAFLDALKESKPATRNRYRALLRSAFKLATKRDIGHRDPMRGIDLEPERNERNRVCSPEEFAKLYDGSADDAELRACIVIGYELGMREAEIVKMTADKLSLKARELRLAGGDTKERSAKTLPLSGSIAHELEQLPRRLDGRVFSITPNALSKRFAVLCGRVGVVDLHFHDLRHTALTRMGEAGVDVFSMAAISGHKTLSMLQRYVHTNPAQLRSAMAKVEAHAAGRDSSKR